MGGRSLVPGASRVLLRDGRMRRALSDFKWLSFLFFDTMNLIFLSIYISVAVLTLDLWLFLITGIIEILYLGVFSFSARAKRRFEERIQCIQGRIKDIDKNRQSVDRFDKSLLVFSVIGFVIILFLGFGKHLLSRVVPYLSHTAGWEVGALIWTWLFILYYFLKATLTGEWIDRIILLFAVGGGTFMVVKALGTLDKPISHLIFVFLASFIVMLCNAFLVWFYNRKILHIDNRIQSGQIQEAEIRMEILRLEKERRISGTSFWWADVPMVISFAILLLYLLVHRDTEDKEVFVSGVVAFQLLISNVIFMVLEFEFLKLPSDKNDEKSRRKRTVQAAGSDRGGG
jgi:hypothetical protein